MGRGVNAVSVVRRQFILIVAALALGLVAAPTADAQLGDLLGGGAGDLIDDTAGDAQESLCGAAQGIDRIAAGILGGETGVGDVACGLGVLEAKFVTVYGTGRNAQPARVHEPVAFLAPNPLDVDGDPEPDLTGRVALSGDRLTLDIDRVSGERSPLPVRVELVVEDPTGELARDSVFFGYDARHDRAPGRFHASTPLSILGVLSEELGLPGGEDGSTERTETPDVSVDWSVTQPGRTLGVTGGLFNGPPKPEERVDPITGRLSYGPVPASGGVDLSIAPGNYEAVVTRDPAASNVRLDVHASIADGRDLTTAIGTVLDLPDRFEVSYGNQAGLRSGSYDGSGPLQGIYADYQSTTAGEVTDHAFVEASGLPRGLEFTQQGLGSRSARIQTTGGAIVNARVGYANRRGWPRFLPRDDPYAYVVSDGSLRSYALKVEDFLSATFRAERDQPISLDAQFLDGGKPFFANVETGVTPELPPLDVKALVRNVPARIFASFDSRTGNVEYDGFGTGIDVIHADIKARSLGRDPIQGGERRPPLFGRVRHIVGELGGVPSRVTAQVMSGPEGFEGFRFSNHEDELIRPPSPLRRAEIVLTDAPEDDPASWSEPGGLARLLDGRSGGRFVDTRGGFEAFGRLRNLRSATLSVLQRRLVPGPNRPRLQTFRNVELDAKFAGPRAPFVAHVQRGSSLSLPAFTADAYLSNVARELALTVNPTRGSVEYHGSTGIDLIHTDIQAQQPLFGRVRHIVGQIDFLPADVTTRIASGAEGFEGLDFEADPGLHQVELMMTNSRPGEDPARWSRPDGLAEELRVEEGPDRAGRPVSGASLTVLPGDGRRRFKAFGRLRGPKRLDVGLDPFTATLETTTRQPLHVTAVYDEADDSQPQGEAFATLRDLPTSLTVEEVGQGLDGIRYRAGELVDSLEATARNLPGSARVDQPHNLDVSIRGIPRALDFFGGCSDGDAAPNGRCPGDGETLNETMGVTTPEVDGEPGRIKRVVARAWAADNVGWTPDRPELPPTDGNFVEAYLASWAPPYYHAAVRAHLRDVDRFLMEELGANGSRIAAGFGVPDPEPTDVNVWTGGSFDDTARAFDPVLRLKAQTPNTPRTLQVTANKGEVAYEAASEIGRLGLGVVTGPRPPLRLNAGSLTAFGGVVNDLPRSLTFCASDVTRKLSGPPAECDEDAPQQFRVDPGTGPNRTIWLSNDLNMFLRTPEPLRISEALLCLNSTRERSEACVPRLARNGTVHFGSGAARGQRLYLNNLRVDDFDLELGDNFTFEPGADSRCGRFACDQDLMKLWLDTPDGAALFDEVAYHDPGDLHLTMLNPRAPGLTANRFFMVLDLTPPPTAEEMASRGSIDCDRLTIELDVPGVVGWLLPFSELECDDVHRLHESGGPWVD